MASTNQFALSLLSKSKPVEGTVISTSHQYEGRGQIGSDWESAPGKNISLSLILYPVFLPPNRQFRLNQAVSLGLKDCVEKFVSRKVKIKWSNDIYINDKKVSGILIQNTLSGSKIQSTVVGIGINVNQTRFLTHPPNPTSFKIETGQSFDLEDVRRALCYCLETRYLQLKSGKTESLHEEYLQNLYRFHQKEPFQKNSGEIFEGKITGIEETGKLLIEKENGTLEAFAVKEVKFL